jgi:hypothetical protein
MKMTVFWDVALCSLLETDRRFRSANCLHHQTYRPGDGGGINVSEKYTASIFRAEGECSKFLRNIGSPHGVRTQKTTIDKLKMIWYDGKTSTAVQQAFRKKCGKMLTEKLFYFRLIYSIQTGYVDYKSFVFS